MENLMIRGRKSMALLYVVQYLTVTLTLYLVWINAKQ